jgi:hypothetical protein
LRTSRAGVAGVRGVAQAMQNEASSGFSRPQFGQASTCEA